MNVKQIFLPVLALIIILACNLPSPQQVNIVQTAIAQTAAAGTAQAPASTTALPSASATSQNTASPAATAPASATACSPLITANSSVNVRSGPGTVYDAIGSFTTGATAAVAGKNSDGTWWYIAFPSGPGGYGWISGSVVTATCVPASVAVIAAPPTPLPASGTCKDGYVWRLIKSSDKVCVPPSEKAQADADNAAAASRLCTAAFGPNTCAQGYVWREAFSGDHVCVVPATHSQAAADNAAAASRVDPVNHTYGPDTCISGYVWREANGSDHVCVTSAIHSQTASDNSAAASHLCTAANGPHTCAQGYVWREAFSGDYVCVTSAVRSQTAADNAAAPSHTW